jgi:fatty acid desaturase
MAQRPRQEQRSAEEDWRAASEAKHARASFFTRWFMLLAVLAIVALTNLILWLSAR